MSLMDKILSSRQQVAAYTVQPYQAVTGIPAYGNRFISPMLVAPPVDDMPHTTAALRKPVGRSQATTPSTPYPTILSNGAAPASGNNSPYVRR